MKYLLVILGSLAWLLDATHLSASEPEGPTPPQVADCLLENGTRASLIETCREPYENLTTTERQAVAEKLVSTCVESGEVATLTRQAGCSRALSWISTSVIPVLIEALEHPQNERRLSDTCQV